MDSRTDKIPEMVSMEAEALGNYLTGKVPETTLCHRYYNMVSTIPRPEPKGVWKNALRHRWLMKLIDGGTALLKVDGPARKRLQIMHAVLECDTSQADFFLPQKQRGLYFFKIVFYALRGAVFALTGAIVVKLLRIR